MKRLSGSWGSWGKGEGVITYGEYYHILLRVQDEILYSVLSFLGVDMYYASRVEN